MKFTSLLDSIIRNSINLIKLVKVQEGALDFLVEIFFYFHNLNSGHLIKYYQYLYSLPKYYQCLVSFTSDTNTEI